MLQHTGRFCSRIFLAKKIVTNLEHPPFLPVLSTEIIIEGMTYDATDIIKNATEQLKRLSQNGYQNCFQSI
jgi:hypothetical protein